jgi:hypothetical protein
MPDKKILTPLKQKTLLQDNIKSIKVPFKYKKNPFRSNSLDQPFKDSQIRSLNRLKKSDLQPFIT